MDPIASRRRALLAGAGTLLLAPVLAGRPALAQAGAAAAAAPDTSVRGFSRERLARLGAALTREASPERNTFPGCVAAIARFGEVVHLEAYGHQDAARTRPMPKDAIFLMASMTKPLTSVAAMMLVEEGRLKLGDPIAQHLPELRDLKLEVRREGQPAELVTPARGPTVQDLLRHTAGFVYAESAPSPRIKELYEQHQIEARGVSVAGDEMLRRLGTIPLAWQPGTTFHYSICTDVLGLLVERVAGQRLDTVIAERITGPLGMTDTAWFVTPAKRGRVAEALDSDPLKAAMWRNYRIERDLRDETYIKGGAGTVSTAQDYLRFAQMLANGGVLDGRRYLSPATVRLMMSNHTAGMAGSPTASTGPGYGFGLGFAVRLADGMAVVPGSPGDAMWAGAWGTFFTIDRAEGGLVAILMTQGPSTRGHSRMLFKNLVYGAMVESARNGTGAG
jgi:CubicO group peptidase (beta-lactamase class C family)